MIDVKLDIKAIPVPLRYQPIYKIVMLLAVLRYGCAKPYAATFLKLHLYMWALRSNENQQILTAIKTKTRDSIVPWVFEPALDQVITLAVINDFCSRTIRAADLQIEIKEKGLEFLTKLEALELFAEDIGRVKDIGVVPQSLIAAVNKKWELY
ncbi:hypothetical protein [Mucilaginibacter ginsenosidivorax]|uniref:Uncharacterized protein n=1 Tax=Mucilaginibacter ginsenosidivorax TaxID=862126 RepID=A0A5B8VZW6_9SPHI|nr:hypothetical protein [Mucilaginibacter ginsenosidivorax]QEC76911.1 hypothetical protein FSB76_13510 [Mucilaginibacter ginsenosidivorax]